MEKKPTFYCQFEPCGKKLVEFAFSLQETGELFCDDICAEHNIEAKAERKSRFLWN